jgi:hypothetical protein
MSLKEINIRTEAGTRRQFFEKISCICGLALTGALTLIGCGKSDQQSPEGGDSGAKQHDPADPCGDLSEVSEKDIAVREKLGYVKDSPLPDNQCQNCNLYLPAKEGQACGGCMLFKGPVYASAYCTYWAPKV